MAKEVKQWITKNGKHIPIYEDAIDKQTREIEQQRVKSDKFNTQKKAQDLLTETAKFKFTHDGMKQMWSRTQVFPIYNQSSAYIKKMDKILDKLEDGSLKTKLEKERYRLYLQHRDLLEPHRQRIIDEVGGMTVWMNDDHYHKLGY